MRGWKSRYCVSYFRTTSICYLSVGVGQEASLSGSLGPASPLLQSESSGTAGVASLAQAGFSSKPGRTWLLWGSRQGAQSLWLVGSSPPPGPCHLGLSIKQRPAWQLLSINSRKGVSKTEDRGFLQPHLGRDSPSAWPRSIE